MSRGEKTERTRPSVLGGIGALLAIVGLFGGVFAVRWAAGECTSALLGAAGRLDVDAYYSGRTRDHLIGIGAYWILALVYALPALVVACFSPFWDVPKGVIARGANYALVGFAVLYTIGVMSFAFDPSRSGGHTPLVERYEEFSYEASDLVMAATWTMIVTAFVTLGASTSSRRATRIVVVAVAFFGSAALFAVAFT
ncbi:hypothetical protein [Aeromicrobium fastidiosum]|uniref:Uncharacterized protein n=1 Tax=Aeromicrobium fastidiosum TaxID=52699 RepID=A0A641AMU9_9ACTN|nr:hypothetical protein [Aeromicrobium fastidiosum]KAA1378608.1 hypothetical protein ESP62_009710 [Aeromicrobium fastidiosum]MBP2392414.1 hypothetical protein [Aeromicrobium fastidiosum]